MEALEHYCLHDLGYKGYKHTWCNRWNNPNIVRGHLIRTCASVDWMVVFFASSVEHLFPNKSDHVLILVKIKDKQNWPF